MEDKNLDGRIMLKSGQDSPSPETNVLTKDREAWQTLVREINGAPTTNNG